MQRFSGIPVYALKSLHRGAAFTLPGIGIFTGSEYSGNIDLLRHEFGHILQARLHGYFRFYLFTGPLSLLSACREQWNIGYLHKNARVETEANILSYAYFKAPDDWDHQSFPLKTKTP